MKSISNIEFLKLTNDNFVKFKQNERLRNDIVRVKFEDGTSECRMYLNNVGMYAVIPENTVMLNEITKKTWTLYVNNGVPTNFIKSNRDDDRLKSILDRYGMGNPKYIYTLKSNEDNPINLEEYLRQRKKFISEHPWSNTGNPDNDVYM